MRPDQEAEFADFVAGRCDRLRQFAYICCGDWHRAEDAVQTALVRLYLNWTRPKHSVDAYARRIIVNVLIAQHRRAWFTRERSTERLPEPAAPDPAERLSDRLSVVNAMLSLPERQRIAIALRYWEDLPVDQTARILGCSKGSVKNLTMRGLATLRGLLSESIVRDIEGATS